MMGNRRASHVPLGERAFQAEGTACAKALGQDGVWYFGGTVRRPRGWSRVSEGKTWGKVRAGRGQAGHVGQRIPL